MSTIKQVADAFVAGRPARCGNAHTDGHQYVLHKSVIARKIDGHIEYDWCGWYTVTTGNHLNHIAAAIHPRAARLRYAQARDVGPAVGTLENQS